MTARIEHPLGLAAPAEWAQTGHASAAEFRKWLESTGTSRASSKWKGKGGRRADLGHSCRSSMEANFERYLRFLGYRPWLEKHPSTPPLESGGKWYRYEGRRWDFVARDGGPIKTHTGFYLSDFEVWPGLIDRSRPYEALEVKGYLDGASKTKLNRMDKQFPEAALELITPERFSELTANASSVVPGWE